MTSGNVKTPALTRKVGHSKQPRAPIVRIDVTENLILTSERANSSHCMISEAVKTARPTAEFISTDLQTIRFSDRERGLRYVYLTPRIGQLALISFDQGEPVAPFTMTLRDGSVHWMQGAKQREHRLRENGLRMPRAAEVRSSTATTTEGHDLRVGGKPPPVGGFAQRRRFGLRMLRA